jgi:DNA-directed RNA polymerase specialized sigma24 family protein
LELKLPNNDELPPIDDVRGWATFMQANPLPTALQSDPSVINRLLKKSRPRDLIDALIAFKDLRRPKEQKYLDRAVFFAIATRVRKQVNKKLSNNGNDLVNDITVDFFSIARDSKHKDHEALRTFFSTVIWRRTIDAVNKHQRENPIMADLDNPVNNPKEPNAMIKFATAAEAELIMIARDAKKLMTPAVRTAYENAINDDEDDDSIGERSRYRNRAKAREIVKSEFDLDFVTALDDDDFFTTKNLPDPRDVCLTAFHFACPDHPTETDVIRWCEAFPQYAKTIREEAEIARTLPTEDEGPDLTSEDIIHLLPALHKLLGC